MNQENKLKQILIMSKDLKCRRGKESAQLSHASNQIILENLEELYEIQY